MGARGGLLGAWVDGVAAGRIRYPPGKVRVPDVWGEGAGPVWASGGGESGKAGSHRLCSPQGRGLWSRRQSAQRPQPPNPRAREWLQERPLAEALASPGSSSEVPGPLAASSRSEESGHTESSSGKTGPGVRGAGGPGPRVRAGHKGLQQRGHGVHKEGPPRGGKGLRTARGLTS